MMWKNPPCPSCSQAFATKDPSRPHGPRLPLLLHCGHTHCEGCLTKIAKAQRTAITCPVCQVKTPLTSEEGSVRSLCPDLYLLGQLAMNRKNVLDQVGLGFMKVGHLLQDIQLQRKGSHDVKIKKELCGECFKKEAACKCVQCDCDMCSICFDKIHSVSRVLKKHQAVPLYEDKSFNADITECKIHENRPIEYFCDDCKFAICSHCVIVGVHKDHAISAMEVKNKEAMAEIGPAIKTASRVLQRLRKSYKVLASVVPQVRQSMLAVRGDIHAHFQTLHAKLQAREMKVLMELDELGQKDVAPLDLMKTQLYEGIMKAETVLKGTEQAMNNEHSLAVSAQNVVNRLNQVAETPCCLEDTKEATNALRFKFEEISLQETLDIHGNVEGGPQFKLSLSVLPEAEDEDEEDTDTLSTSTKEADSISISSTDPSYISWADAVSEADSETSSLLSCTDFSDISKVKDKPKKKYLRKTLIAPKHQELVYVTHIKHPCHFMVQCCSSAAELEKLTRAMQKHCANTTPANVPQTVQPDDVVLAQFSQDKAWYRARVRDIVLEDEDPTKAKIAVSYVDFGNTEVIQKASLRKMPNKFFALPELAVQASLMDIVSADESGQWSVECVHSFAKMTEDKPMTLHVYSQDEDGILKVDLCKPENDDYVDDRPVSVRDALVFLELACFTSVYSKPQYPGGRVPKPKRSYLKPAPLTLLAQFDAYITHSSSPDSFYVQEVGEHSKYLADLMSNLQRIYNSDQKDLWTIFCPQRDMVCVAKYVDNQWYRAQVIALPGRRNVDVFYVDFGNVERVSYLKLKYIKETLMVLPVQSIHCRLAGVEPLEGQTWSTEAIAKLNAFNVGGLQATVKDTDGDRYSLQLTGQDSVCINKLLVTSGLAASTDHCTETESRYENEEVYHFKQNVPRPSAMVRMATRVNSSTKELSSVKAGETTASQSLQGALPSGAKQRYPRQHAPVKSTAKSAQTKAPSSVPQEETPNKPDHMEVIVTHFIDPGHFYVQLTTAMADGLETLTADLQKPPDESEEATTDWTPGDYCAARFGKENLWNRAKILAENKDEGTFEVFLLDYGNRGKVTKSSLHHLKKSQQAMVTCALRCHLVGIQPAGDATRWSRTACEVMTDVLNNKSVYILPKGEVDKESLPIDLLVECIIEGDALNLETTEYNSLSEELLEKGVALPRRTLNRQTSDPQVTQPPKPAVESAVTDKTCNDVEKAVCDNTDVSATVSKPVEEVEALEPQSVEQVEHIPQEAERATPIEPKKEEDRGSEVGAGEPSAHVLPTVVSNLSPETGDSISQFAPARLPGQRHIRVVPTFVNWEGIIYAQMLKEDEDVEGRFGFLLKENTLETVLQDSYLSSRSLHRARIPRDGNCLFRAFAQAIFADQGQQNEMRLQVVNHIEKNWNAGYVSVGDTDQSTYLSAMRKDATYGGEPEINALCEVYNVTADLYLGGLHYPVQVRRYGKSDKASIKLVYISDGNIDSGHYDVAVDSLAAVMPIEEIYCSWRKLKLIQVSELPKYSDNTIYGKVAACLENPVDESLLHQLMEHLQTKYEGSDPDYEASWTVGQSVIVRYTQDEQFYRAKITDVVDEGIKVLYVDFGNSEIVHPGRLRRKLVLEKVPTQCLECQIAGIKPNQVNGAWTKAVLEYIHKQLVGYECSMDILGEIVSLPLKVNVTLPDGQDLGALLRNLELAVSEDEEVHAMVMEDVMTNGHVAEENDSLSDLSECTVKMPERKVPSPYAMLQLSDPETPYIVTATHIVTPNTVYLQRVRCQEAVDVDINKQLDELLAAAQQLNTEADDYPPLACIKPGIACCARYTCDECWYRGEIISVQVENEEMLAGVLFVDYGSFEYIGSARLKVLPGKLMALPAQGIPCRIPGLQPPEGGTDWDLLAAAMMTDLITNKLLLAMFKCVHPEFEVELFDYDEMQAQGELGLPIYRLLIDEGLAQGAGTVMDEGTIVEESFVLEENYLANEVD